MNYQIHFVLAPKCEVCVLVSVYVSIVLHGVHGVKLYLDKVCVYLVD